MNKKTESPRGLRNNNPGNIRINDDLFKGEVRPSRDKSFKQFETMAYGYRAMFRILFNYYHRYSLTTIRKMISRWASPDDGNHTDKYIKAVSSYAGIPADDPLVFDREQMIRIVVGMSRVENGCEAVMSDVIEGWNLL